jgi:hypothetical protein
MTVELPRRYPIRTRAMLSRWNDWALFSSSRDMISGHCAARAARLDFVGK